MALAVAVAISLFGCGKSTPTATPAPANDAKTAKASDPAPVTTPPPAAAPSATPPVTSTGAPELIGKPLTAAIGDIANAGLAAGIVTKVPGNGASGTVVNQSPGPRSPVAAGQKVQLWVGDDSIVAVPNVKGMPLDQARSELAKARLSISRTDAQIAQQGSPLTVAVQNPAAAAVVSPGSAVSLVMNPGPIETNTVSGGDYLDAKNGSTLAACQQLCLSRVDCKTYSFTSQLQVKVNGVPTKSPTAYCMLSSKLGSPKHTDDTTSSQILRNW